MAALVSSISQQVTLQPGDLIYTGTPGESAGLHLPGLQVVLSCLCHIAFGLMNSFPLPGSGPGGFTRADLTVTLGVCGLLSTLLLAGATFDQEKTARLGCLNNLRQMGVGTFAYAADDVDQAYSGAASVSDDDLNWLYPRYVSNLDVFRCPATSNSIRQNFGSQVTPSEYVSRLHGQEQILTDLTRMALRKTGFGLSYEGFGYMNCCGVQNRAAWTTRFGVPRFGILKTESTVNGYTHNNRTWGLKGRVVKPSEIFLIREQDVDYVDSRQSFPDEMDNHGAAGENWLFADGQAAWVRADEYAHEYIYRYELSQDEGRPP